MANDREFSPIKGTFPDAKKIQCADCFNRDRTVVKVGNKTIYAGVTKAYCNAYLPPPDSNGKPHEILFSGAKCRFYCKDSD